MRYHEMTDDQRAIFYERREAYNAKLIVEMERILGRKLTEFEVAWSRARIDEAELEVPVAQRAKGAIASLWNGGYLIQDEMIIEIIEQRLAEIKRLENQVDDPHRKEDILYRDVLATIAKHGDKMSAALASAALKSKDINFSRYYAQRRGSMDGKPTPGPWEVNTQGGPNRTEVFSGDTRICDTLSGTVHYDTEDGECEANAQLISAAPELLEAHEPDADMPGPDFLDWIADRMVNVYGESEGIDFVLALRRKAEKTRKAIAKAIGEPK